MDIPFTYLIGWSKNNQYYYGVRYAIGCHPSQLWESYFTSSNEVADYVKENGNPDIIQVRKTFTEPETAREWEHRVLRRMRVIKRNDFLNKSAGKNNGFYQRTEKHLKALSEKAKKETHLEKYQFTPETSGTYYWTEESYKKVSEARKEYLKENPPIGKKNSFFGKLHKEETKEVFAQKRKEWWAKNPDAHSGSNNPMAKGFFAEGKIYGSQKEAYTDLGISRYEILKRCKTNPEKYKRMD